MKWEDFKKELDAIPGVRESFERYYPYHDLSLEIGGVRADLDMTQTEFGALVGVPQSTVARLESGQQNPSVGMLQRIAKATDMELFIEFRPTKRKHRRANRRKTETPPTAEPTRAEPVAASSRTR